MNPPIFNIQTPPAAPAYSTLAFNEDAIANLITHSSALLIRIGHIAGAIHPLQQISRPSSTTHEARSPFSLSSRIIFPLKHITYFTNGVTATKTTRGSFLPNYRKVVALHAPTVLAGYLDDLRDLILCARL
ncbi:hypothetical protein Daus18300_012715 [Diaporthe australafricana]|uniref:Uncharacterized protein n=1 Tax=Diaporthe australafricana TaxID=127596 RepID=A0ABR3W1M3_9PEZI